MRIKKGDKLPYSTHSKVHREFRRQERLAMKERKFLPPISPPRGKPNVVRTHSGRFEIRVDRELAYKFKKLCYEKGISAAEAIRRLIEHDVSIWQLKAGLESVEPLELDRNDPADATAA